MNDLIRLIDFLVDCVLKCDDIPNDDKVQLVKLRSYIDTRKDYRFISICTGQKLRDNKMSAARRRAWQEHRDTFPLLVVHDDGTEYVLQGQKEIEEAFGFSIYIAKNLIKPSRVKAGLNKARLKKTLEKVSIYRVQ